MLMTLDSLRVPAWTVIIIIAREFLVTGARSLAASDGVVIAANVFGKFKTVLQMTYVFVFLALAVFERAVAILVARYAGNVRPNSQSGIALGRRGCGFVHGLLRHSIRAIELAYPELGEAIVSDIAPLSTAHVDLKAYAHNLNVVREMIPEGCRIMGIVKADAYGHGAVPICQMRRQRRCGDVGRRVGRGRP